MCSTIPRWSRASACSIFASGSGLVAIAAAKAGAAPVSRPRSTPSPKPQSHSTRPRTASYVEILRHDLLDHAGAAIARYDVILVGDLFYEQETAARALAFLDRHAALGTRVLIGDPGRTYLPKQRLAKLAEYCIPVTRDLEDMEIKNTAVWTLGI